MKIKAIVLILLFTMPFIILSCATLNQPLQEPMKIQRIEEIQLSKNKIYRYANEWMAKRFVKAKEVIQYQDKEEGVIIGRGILRHYINDNPVDFKFVMKVECKDNKIRVTIDNISGEMDFGNLPIPVDTTKLDDEEYNDLKIAFEALINDLLNYIKESTEEW